MGLAHGVDELTAQQIERRLAVEFHVVKGIRDDLRQPDEPRLHVAADRTNARSGTAARRCRRRARSPRRACTNSCAAGMGGINPKNAGTAAAAPAMRAQMTCRMTLRRRLYPTLMSSLYSCVTWLTSSYPLGSKKKWPDCRLTMATSQPIKAAATGIGEHHDVGNEEADCAQQVQGLIDAAVVVVAVIVPTLRSQFRPKISHRGSFK